MDKVLNILKQAQFYLSLFIPVIEQVIQKDINGDGKIGR